MKLQRLEQITALITLFLLLGTCCVVYLKIIENNAKNKVHKSHKWSFTVCFTAAMAYIVFLTDSIPIHQSDVRSIDWLITCPLLLIEMGRLLETSTSFDSNITAAIFASIFMNIFGWGGAPNGICLLLAFTMLFFVAIHLHVMYKKSVSKHRNKVMFFFSFWFLYGIIASLRLLYFTPSMANIGYNVLDLITKAGLGLAFLDI